MAGVIVRSWQETYRGLMSNAVLDDPGLVATRERFWTAALTDERYRKNRVAVAERVALWVADPNPRAQAFYRKHGFVADGTIQVEGGVLEIRMVRGMQHSR
jgi:hypothetical protein